MALNLNDLGTARLHLPVSLCLMLAGMGFPLDLRAADRAGLIVVADAESAAEFPGRGRNREQLHTEIFQVKRKSR